MGFHHISNKWGKLYNHGKGVPGGRHQGLVVTEFSQIIGPANLLSNGNMETGNPPTGWTAESSTLSTAADERTGGAGVSSLKSTYGTASPYYAYQSVDLVQGGWYEISGWSRVAAGAGVATRLASLATGAGGGYSYLGINTGSATWRTEMGLFRALTATSRYYLICTGPASSEGNFDDQSLQRITLNTMQQMPTSDSTIIFEYTLPTAPLARQRTSVLFRISGAGVEVAAPNYWVARIIRDDSNTQWNFQLDTVISGIVANKSTVTNVGSTDSIKIVPTGTTITCYTGLSGVYTQRDSPVVLDFNTVEKGVLTMYNSGFTPIRLRSF